METLKNVLLTSFCGFLLCAQATKVGVGKDAENGTDFITLELDEMTSLVRRSKQAALDFAYYDDLTSSAIAGMLIVFYMVYYCTRVYSKPQVVTNANGALYQFLMKHCAFASERYAPPIWCFEAHMQTVLRSIVRRYTLEMPYRRVTLQLADGGELFVDWLDNETNNSKYPDCRTRPTVLILPGLTGHSGENYVKYMARQIAHRGYRIAVFNYRGTGNSTLKTPKFYSALSVQDVNAAVEHVHSSYPRAPLIAAGVSLGGIILFNYLAQAGKNTPLLSAFSSSAAWDIVESARNLEQPLNRFLFNRYLASLLVRNVHRNLNILKFTGQYDLERVLQSKTIRDFDRHLTTKMFGYASAEQYYQDASPYLKMDRIEVPLVSLSAADDPFAPLHTLPLETLSRSDRLAMVLTSRGGHNGFLEGLLLPRSTLLERAVAQYASAVFENRDEWQRVVDSMHRDNR